MTAIDSLFSLDGRVALVTGASRGLGLVMAEGLAESGATVVLNGRHSDTLEAACRLFEKHGLKAEALPFDVTNGEAVAGAINLIGERHGRLDIVIANAGIIHRAKLADWTPEIWDEILATDLTSCFFLAQHAAKLMQRRRKGRIIFTTSINGLLGRSTIHAYVASKSGLSGITRSLAAELGEFGVTCNSIAPGYFETEFTAALMQDKAFVARINARVPLKRWGKPRELAGVAAFLASDAASYITGSAARGGRRLHHNHVNQSITAITPKLVLRATPVRVIGMSGYGAARPFSNVRCSVNRENSGYGKSASARPSTPRRNGSAWPAYCPRYRRLTRAIAA